MHDFHKMAEVQRILAEGDADAITELALNLAQELIDLEARVAKLEGRAADESGTRVSEMVARVLPDA